MRPIAWRGSEQMGVSAQNNRINCAIAIWQWPSYFDPAQKLKGIRLDIAEYRRPDPRTAPSRAKAAGLYMICTLSKHAAEAKGYADAMMFDWRGYVAEATGANMFFVKDGKIQVQNQDHCKTDCPACSRVCPEVAIMFPKYRHGPINGDVVSADDIRREAMKVDISALLGGDIYAQLRDRSAKAKSRFSKERDEDRALTERQNCLVKLKQQMNLDIPAEVLAALPSPDEIRATAEAAAARAQEALAANAANAGREVEG